MARERGTTSTTPSKSVGIIEFKAFLEANGSSNFKQTSITHLKACKRLMNESKSLQCFDNLKERVVLMIMNNICSPIQEVRKMASDLFSMVMDQLKDSNETLISVLSNPLCDVTKNMIEMCKTSQHDYVFKHWMIILNTLDSALHKNRNLLNSLLIVLEKAFKINIPDVQTSSYKTWEGLINNFALDKNLLVSAKRIKLLMQPLLSLKSYTEDTNVARFEAWWHLAFRMEEKLHSEFSTIILPLLNRTLNIQADVTAKINLNNSNASSSSRLGTSLSEPARFKKVQMKGCEILIRLLELPVISAVGLASPKKAPQNSTKSLKEPIPNVIFQRHSSELLKHCKTVIGIYKEHRMSQGTQYVLHLVLERMSSVSKELKDNQDTISNILHFFQTVIKEGYLEPGNSLKLIDEICRSLPSGLLSSHSLRPPSDSPETMVPAFAFLKLMMKKEFIGHVFANSLFIPTISRVTIAGAEENSSFLKFFNSVYTLLEDLFSGEEKDNYNQSETLLKMWLKISEALFERVENTQEVNMGDTLEHNFSTILSALIIPSKILLRQPSLEIAAQSKEEKCWQNLCKALFQYSGKIESIEPNTCCEELSNQLSLLSETSSVSPCLNFWSHQAQCIVVILEAINFEPLNASTFNRRSSVGKKKNSDPLGTLHSLCKLLDKVLKNCVTLEESCSKRKKNKALLTYQETSFNLFESFVTYVNNIDVLLSLIEHLTPTIVFLLSHTAKKSGSLQFLNKVENMFRVLADKFRLRCQSHGICGQKHFDVLSPILEKALQHSTGIEDKARKLWNSVFAPIRAELKLSDSFKKVLAKSVPPLVMAVDISSPEDNNACTNIFESEGSSSDLGEIGQTSSTGFKFGYSSLNTSDSGAKVPTDTSTPRKTSVAIKKSPASSQKSVKKSEVDYKTSAKTPSSKKESVKAEKTPKKDIFKVPFDELRDEDFVKIDSSKKGAPKLLTEHQKEAKKEKSFIPSLYSDLSQNTRTDSLDFPSSNSENELSQIEPLIINESPIKVPGVQSNVVEERYANASLQSSVESKNESSTLDDGKIRLQSGDTAESDLNATSTTPPKPKDVQPYKFDVFEVPQSMDFSKIPDKSTEIPVKFTSKSVVPKSSSEVSFPYKEGGVLESEIVPLEPTKRKRAMTGKKTTPSDAKKARKTSSSSSGSSSSKETKNPVVLAMEKLKYPLGRKKLKVSVPKLSDKLTASLTPIACPSIPEEKGKEEESVQPTSSSELLNLISVPTKLDSSLIVSNQEVSDKPEPVVIDVDSENADTLPNTIDISGDSCPSQQPEVLKNIDSRKRNLSSLSSTDECPEKKRMKLTPAADEDASIIPETCDASLGSSDQDLENTKENENPELESLEKSSELKDSKLTDKEAPSLESRAEIPEVPKSTLSSLTPQKDNPDDVLASAKRTQIIDTLPSTSTKKDKTKINSSKSHNDEPSTPARSTRLQMRSGLNLRTKIVTPVSESKLAKEKKQKKKTPKVSNESEPEKTSSHPESSSNDTDPEEGDVARKGDEAKSMETAVENVEPIESVDECEEIETVHESKSVTEIVNEPEVLEDLDTHEPKSMDIFDEPPVEHESMETIDESLLAANKTNSLDSVDDSTLLDDINTRTAIKVFGESKLVKTFDETKFLEGADESKLLEGVDESKLLQSFAQPKTPETIDEPELMENVDEEKPTENVEKPTTMETVETVQPNAAAAVVDEPELMENVENPTTMATVETVQPKAAAVVDEPKLVENVDEEKPTENVEKPTMETVETVQPKAAAVVDDSREVENIDEPQLVCEPKPSDTTRFIDTSVESNLSDTTDTSTSLNKNEVPNNEKELFEHEEAVPQSEVGDQEQLIKTSEEMDNGSMENTVISEKGLHESAAAISDELNHEFNNDKPSTSSASTNDLFVTGMENIDNVFDEVDTDEWTDARSPPKTPHQLKKQKMVFVGGSPLSRSQRMLQAAIGKSNTSSPKRVVEYSPKDSSPKSKTSSAFSGDSPTTGILKNKRKNTSDSKSDQSPSPPNKQRRVSFADPLTEQFVVDSLKKTPRRLRLLPLQPNEPVAVDVNLEERPAAPLVEPIEANSQLTGEISASPEETLDLDSQEPVFSQLLNCQENVELILHNLTSSFWAKSLEDLLTSKNIHSIGELCKLTPLDIHSLPLLEPKVQTLVAALSKHLGSCTCASDAVIKETKEVEDIPFVAETRGEDKEVIEDGSSPLNDDVEKIIEKYLTPEKTPQPDCEVKDPSEVETGIVQRPLHALSYTAFTREVEKRMDSMTTNEILQFVVDVSTKAKNVVTK